MARKSGMHGREADGGAATAQLEPRTHREQEIHSNEPRAVTIRASDGRELAGSLVTAANPRGAILVSAGAGFPREFYLKFARYAAERGYHALVYDYRGMGASRREPLRDEPVRMLDWAMLDIPAAFDWLAREYAHLPLFTVGHSIGAQFIGLLPEPQRARAHVMIAASTAYWRLEHRPFRYMALFFWRIYGPLMLSQRGYVPQGRVWTGLSLPPGVFLQWREWAMRPEHFRPSLEAHVSERLTAFRGPVLLCAFEDDPIATRRSVPPLLAWYASAQIEQRWTKPSDVGARRIGHQGFFSERFRDSLWRPVLDWLDTRG